MSSTHRGESASSPIELTPGEAGIAVMVGVMRHMKAIAHGRRHYGNSKEAFDKHIEGALGEAAFAKWSGLYWHPTIGDIDKPDFAGLEIRTTKHNNGHLFVYKKDPEDKRFVLITGHLMQRGQDDNVCVWKGYVRGCMSGRIAKQSHYWDENRETPCYAIPQGDLSPVEI